MGSTKTKVMDNQTTEGIQADAAEEKKASKKKAHVRGKKYQENRAKVDKSKLYDLSEAIKIITETSYSKFTGSMEMHLVVKKDGLNVSVSLPHSLGSSKKIEIADEKTIEKLKANKVDFDILLATPDMMPKLVPFARILGPKGMMPNPKNGTLIKSVEAAKNFSTDDLNIKTEKKAPLIHTVFGKTDMKVEDLVGNAEAIIKAVNPRLIVKLSICASMSPSVKVRVE